MLTKVVSHHSAQESHIGDAGSGLELLLAGLGAEPCLLQAPPQHGRLRHEQEAGQSLHPGQGMV